jgi:hypothetical protein
MGAPRVAQALILAQPDESRKRSGVCGEHQARYPLDVAGKKGNGRDGEMVEILREIRSEMAALRVSVDATNARLDALRQEVHMDLGQIHEDSIVLQAGQTSIVNGLRSEAIFKPAAE